MSSATATHFTTFAVAGGSGMVGSALVNGLVGAGAKRVLVLSRSSETKVPEGAEVVGVDFDDKASVTNALEGIEVVISCLRDTQERQQPILAEAAKAAGCALFLPSEFGSDSADLGPDSFMYHKRTAITHLEQLGLPYLQVFVGLFPDTTFLPGRFGFDFNDGKATILGTGDEMYSFTTTRDIGTFLGPLLTTRPTPELTQLKKISIQGDRLSLNDVVRLYEAAHPGHKIAVTHQPIVDAQREHDAIEGFNFKKLVLWLLLDWASGAADVTKGGRVEVANGLVRGWRPETVAKYLAKLEGGEVAGEEPKISGYSASSH